MSFLGSLWVTVNSESRSATAAVVAVGLRDAISTDKLDFLSWHKIVNGGRGSSISHVMEASGWTTIVGRYLLQGLALHHPSFAPLLPATTTTALKITDFEEKTGLVCNRPEDGWPTTASTLRLE